jgi:UDP-glucose 4-epimerase
VGDEVERPWATLRGKRVVVTGGAGFIGSNIVAELVATEAQVVVVDDFFTGSFASIPSGIELVAGSVAEKAVMQKACDGAHTVIHAAARNIIVSTSNPIEDYEVNIGGTLNVLLAAREAGVHQLVYTSSCSVYGNKQRLPITEDDPVSLLNPYAVSKFAGESYCNAFYETYGLPAAVVRYSNVYGPGQRPDNQYCGVVARFFDAALTGRPMRVYGDGEQTRDYTFIRDVVGATLTAAVSPKAVGNVYNVATGRETSANELARLIGEIVQTDVEHVGLRDIDTVSRRSLSNEKIRHELRWSPRISLGRGLLETYQWLSG